MMNTEPLPDALLSDHDPGALVAFKDYAMNVGYEVIESLDGPDPLLHAAHAVSYLRRVVVGQCRPDQPLHRCPVTSIGLARVEVWRPGYPARFPTLALQVNRHTCPIIDRFVIYPCNWVSLAADDPDWSHEHALSIMQTLKIQERIST